MKVFNVLSLSLICAICVTATGCFTNSTKSPTSPSPISSLSIHASIFSGPLTKGGLATAISVELYDMADSGHGIVGATVTVNNIDVPDQGLGKYYTDILDSVISPGNNATLSVTCLKGDITISGTMPQAGDRFFNIPSCYNGSQLVMGMAN